MGVGETFTGSIFVDADQSSSVLNNEIEIYFGLSGAQRVRVGVVLVDGVITVGDVAYNSSHLADVTTGVVSYGGGVYRVYASATNIHTNP